MNSANKIELIFFIEDFAFSFFNYLVSTKANYCLFSGDCHQRLSIIEYYFHKYYIFIIPLIILNRIIFLVKHHSKCYY